MRLEKLELKNFRNFLNREFEFTPGLTVVVGENGSGKTNLMEAISFLSLGRSCRANLEREMISFGKESASVKGKIFLDGEGKELLGAIVLGQKREFSEKRPTLKRFFINSAKKKMTDFSGKFLSVLFSPGDLLVVIGSPSRRRKYFDEVLSLANDEYRRSLLSYEKGLASRNRVLIKIREEGGGRSELAFWDRLLTKNGQFLTGAREGFVDYFNEKLSGGGRFFNGKLEMVYEKSVISESRLAEYAEAEIGAGVTLVGPHRDDFYLSASKRRLESFGSRGEQRMAALALRVVQLEFINEKLGARPVLLLDDLFSELDVHHRSIIVDLGKRQQTILTVIEEDDIPRELGEYKRIELGG